MIRFRSVVSRIVALHLLAIVAASICMPVALFLMLNSAAQGLHQRALARPGGRDPALSREDARRDSSIVAAARSRRVLFRRLWARCFRGARRQRAGAVFLAAGKPPHRVRAAQGSALPILLAAARRRSLLRRDRDHRFRRPPALGAGCRGPRPSRRADRRHRRRVLYPGRLDHRAAAAAAAADRRADLPARDQADHRRLRAGRGNRARPYRAQIARDRHAARGAAARPRRQSCARSARRGVPRPARVHRRCGARAAHPAGDPAHPDRHDRGPRDGRAAAAGCRKHEPAGQPAARNVGARNLCRRRGRNRRSRRDRDRHRGVSRPARPLAAQERGGDRRVAAGAGARQWRCARARGSQSRRKRARPHPARNDRRDRGGAATG